MGHVESFAISSYASSDALRRWNDAAHETFGPIRVEPRARAFAGQMRRRQFGPLQLTSVVSTPVMVQGLNAGHDQAGRFFFAVHRGACRLRQQGGERLVSAGELTVLDAGDAFSIQTDQPHEVDILHLPAGALADRHVGALSAPQGELFFAFIRHLSQWRHDDAPLPGGMAQLAMDLLNLCWPIPRAGTLDPGAQPGRQSAAQWQQRLRQLVDRHLDEPGLDAEWLATRLGISKRYVQRLFAGMGGSCSSFVQETRLQRAANMLRDDPAIRISDAAYAVGFDDLSRFCNRFRQRFGCSARDYRKAACTPGDK